MESEGVWYRDGIWGKRVLTMGIPLGILALFPSEAMALFGS